MFTTLDRHDREECSQLTAVILQAGGRAEPCVWCLAEDVLGFGVFRPEMMVAVGENGFRRASPSEGE